MSDLLKKDERTFLLRIARESIVAAVQREKPPLIDLDNCSPVLSEEGASFVTLTIRQSGDLRGCIGALEAYQPLVLDVQEHAIAAAMEDYRFRPLSIEEIRLIQIEISRLTSPQPLQYANPEELIQKLRPNIDGVILKYGRYRATFLPQVWEKLPEAEEFLTHLCFKMGLPGDSWRSMPLLASVYQVEEFHD